MFGKTLLLWMSDIPDDRSVWQKGVRNLKKKNNKILKIRCPTSEFD